MLTDSSLLLSLIIPVYNSEDTLADCLDSILCQSYTAYEIIVVNDGSTDRSPVIIETFRKEYPRIITVISQPNGGIGCARNKGIAAVSGFY